MPGFQACLLVDRPARTGVVVLANSTTGLRPDTIATRLLDTLEAAEPTLADVWEPSQRVPREVAEVLGVWYWGNTPLQCRWDGARVQMGTLEGGRASTFRLRDGVLMGTSGYHHGEQLLPVRRDGRRGGPPELLDVRADPHPLRPSAPIPGGVPRRP